MCVCVCPGCLARLLQILPGPPSPGRPGGSPLCGLGFHSGCPQFPNTLAQKPDLKILEPGEQDMAKEQ